MAENSKIQWTDHTFNPWRGCAKVSPGCKNCYADTLSKRNPSTLGIWGSKASGATRVVASEAMWRKPLKWDNDAAQAGVRHRVFCASLGDVFEEWPWSMLSSSGQVLKEALLPRSGYIPMRDRDDDPPVTMDDVRRRLFDLIDATPNLDWLLLTKRPENIHGMWVPRAVGHPNKLDDGYHRSNVWLGTSVENQEQADKRIPELLKCRDLSARVFLSCEPLLESVNLFGGSDLDWVIAGGESGPGARPCNIQWIRWLKNQCESASVPFFCKQLGSAPYLDDSSVMGAPLDLANLSPLPGAAMKDKKGGDIDEWPDDLRVRQVPEVR